MKKQLYSGIPSSNYWEVTTFRVVNREWRVTVNFDHFPDYTNWKIYLTTGKLPTKANYRIGYSNSLKRFIHNRELIAFQEEFPSELVRLIEDLSEFIFGLYIDSLPESEPEANKERET